MDSLYIKFDDYIKVNHPKVTIGDVAKIYSSNKSIASKIKTLKLHKLDSGEHSRIVFSSLKVVEIIEEEYPNLDITLIGADDFLISYDYKKPTPKWITCILVGFICLILFFGAAFTIMAFNNDISVSKLFLKIHESITGKTSNNHSLLEVGYSIGIPLGIIIFYNHFGKKRITKDPTPIEIEMRLYENDINTALIDGVKRKDCNIDVDD
ncbi:MAG: stage V sporulation protein AA [Lachnospiraceae bacterium]|nr:stage V sporulation protein AA [Lachnospiraceae bacterium]